MILGSIRWQPALLYSSFIRASCSGRDERVSHLLMRSQRSFLGTIAPRSPQVIVVCKAPFSTLPTPNVSKKANAAADGKKTRRKALKAVTYDHREFDKTPYLSLFLQEGKFNGKKIAPGFGPVSVANLIEAMGGERQLIEALENKEVSVLVAMGKLKPPVGQELISTWESIWSADPEKTALTMLTLAGLPGEKIHRFWKSPFLFAEDLKRLPFETLQRLNTSRAIRRKIERFIANQKIHVTPQQRVALYAKGIMLESSQVCFAADELLDILKIESQRSDEEYAQESPSTSLVDIDVDLLQRALLSGPGSEFKIRNGMYYLDHNWHNEQRVADLLAERVRKAETLEKLPPYDLSVLSSTLSTEQKEAIVKGLGSRLFLLSGGPGTGKTYCFGQMLRAWEACNTRVLVASYTARSAQNLRDIAGAVNAMTIHKALDAIKLKHTSYFRQEELDCQVLVLDEATMIDLGLFRELLERLPTQASLILLGDPDQLPSISPGSVLSDLFDEGIEDIVPRARLTEPRRHEGAHESPIHKMAQALNAGEFPDSASFVKVSGFHFNVKMLKPGDRSVWINAFPTRDAIFNIVRQLLSLHPGEDVQVLVPGRAEYHNSYLKGLFRKSEGVPIKSEHAGFVVGDRVMNTRNDRHLDVVNGEIGIVTNILGSIVQVQFADNKLVSYTSLPGTKNLDAEYAGDDDLPKGSARLNLKDLTLAYVMTVHKAQGCEFPVVVCILDSMYALGTRQMLFTACTRAKERLFVVGVRNTIETFIATNEVRHSNLIAIIRQQLEADPRVEDVALENTIPKEMAVDIRERDFAIARFKELGLQSWVSGAFSEMPKQALTTIDLSTSDKEALLPEEPANTFLEEPETEQSTERLDQPHPESANRGATLVAPHPVIRQRGRPPLPPHLRKRAPVIVVSDTHARSSEVARTAIADMDISNRDIGENSKSSECPDGDGFISVPSAWDDKRVYRVNLKKQTCTCSGFSQRSWCKHLDSVLVNSGR